MSCKPAEWRYLFIVPLQVLLSLICFTCEYKRRVYKFLGVRLSSCYPRLLLFHLHTMVFDDYKFVNRCRYCCLIPVVHKKYWLSVLENLAKSTLKHKGINVPFWTTCLGYQMFIPTLAAYIEPINVHIHAVSSIYTKTY